jgi:hypothetical protein
MRFLARVCIGWGLFFSFAALPAYAAPSLDHIHALLMQVRADRSSDKTAFHFDGDDPRARGAMPVLMEVKHGLRDWIEMRLQNLRGEDDLAGLVKTLNAELDAADLTCNAPSAPNRCMANEFDYDATGYLTGVDIKMQGYTIEYSETAANHEGPRSGLLIVNTDVGIVCGSDESAYVYEWTDGRVKRILDDEQIIAEGKPYTPQTIDAVQIAMPDEKTKTRNILVLGNEGWCSSTWYRTYHRIYRASTDGKPANQLLSNATFSWLANDPPIEGSIGKEEALVEFRVGSLDGGVHSYETVRHYDLRGANPVRIDPVALGPRAFVEEWLKMEWSDAQRWADPANAAALQGWHKKQQDKHIFGEFTDTNFCPNRRDQWLVGINFEDENLKSQGVAYFRIEWRPPYRFKMLAIIDKPAADCAEADPSADEDRTLFPVQDWVGWK